MNWFSGLAEGLIPGSAGGVGARGRAGRGGCLLRLPAGRPVGPQARKWLGDVLWVLRAEQPLNTSQSWSCVPQTAWPGRGCVLGRPPRGGQHAAAAHAAGPPPASAPCGRLSRTTAASCWEQLEAVRQRAAGGRCRCRCGRPAVSRPRAAAPTQTTLLQGAGSRTLSPSCSRVQPSGRSLAAGARS